MDISIILTFISFFGGITFIFLGLSRIIGFGWIAFIFDLIIVTGEESYSRSKKKFPPSKTKSGKFIGFGLICLGIVLIGYCLNINQ